MAQPSQTDNRERDIATFKVLGIFFAIMGVLVLVASYQAWGNMPAFIVNVCSAFVLLFVGTGSLWISRRLARRSQ